MRRPLVEHVLVRALRALQQPHEQIRLGVLLATVLVIVFGPGGNSSCRGLQLKRVGTAISAVLGPHYLQLSVPPGPDYLPLRLQSAARDCNHPVRDHIICQSP